MNGCTRPLKSKAQLAVFVMLILCLTVFVPFPVLALSSTEISVVNPLTGNNNFFFTTNATSVGHKFPAMAKVFNVDKMVSWQVSLKFDPVHLRILNVSVPADNIFAGKTILAPEPQLDNLEGTMLYGATTLQLYEFTGSGNLMQAWFEITEAPALGSTLSSMIQIVKEPPYRTYLEDPDGNEISFTPEHGSYRYVSSEAARYALIYVDPAQIANISLTPSHNFSVRVNILDATQLYAFNFTLRFKATLLNALSADLGSLFLPTANYTAKIDNASGIVVFSATLKPPEPPKDGNGTLATITFHVESLGMCNLTLTDTYLYNQGGDTLPHNTKDGYFNNKLIVGDVNGDGVVDMKDIVAIGHALGTQLGDSRWNAGADLNNDGKIDLRDIVKALRNYGKTS